MFNNKEYSYNNLEHFLKIFKYKQLCNLNKITEAMKFYKENANAIDRKYLSLLVNNNFVIEPEDDINDSDSLAGLYAEAVYTFYGISSITRLTRRIAYGIVSYKTYKCGNNMNCPACCKIVEGVRDTLPYAKRDVSVVICSDCGDVTDHNNLPYVYDSSYVYCKRCTEELGKSSFCKVTGNVCMSLPRICYFV